MALGEFWIRSLPDGGTRIGYEDYGVACFGGGDYEANYTLDRENTELLVRKLSAGHTGTLRQMLEEEFGACREKKSFQMWLDANGIRYELFTWISMD